MNDLLGRYVRNIKKSRILLITIINNIINNFTDTTPAISKGGNFSPFSFFVILRLVVQK